MNLEIDCKHVIFYILLLMILDSWLYRRVSIILSQHPEMSNCQLCFLSHRGSLNCSKVSFSLFSLWY
jgi:hypothetical protein